MHSQRLASKSCYYEIWVILGHSKVGQNLVQAPLMEMSDLSLANSYSLLFMTTNCPSNSLYFTSPSMQYLSLPLSKLSPYKLSLPPNINYTSHFRSSSNWYHWFFDKIYRTLENKLIISFYFFPVISTVMKIKSDK